MSGDKIPAIDPKTGQFVRPSKGERIVQLIGLLEGEYFNLSEEGQETFDELIKEVLE